MRPRAVWIVALVVLGACRPSGAGHSSSSVRLPDTSVSGHPRLWVRAADLPQLRAWATSSNPMWESLI